MITIKTDAELMIAYDNILDLGESCLKILVDIKSKTNAELMESISEIESVESFEIISPDDVPEPLQENPGNSTYYSNEDIDVSTEICNARMDILETKLS